MAEPYTPSTDEQKASYLRNFILAYGLGSEGTLRDMAVSPDWAAAAAMAGVVPDDLREENMAVQGYIKVGADEYIKKDAYNALPSAMREKLSNVGTTGYNQWLDSIKSSLAPYRVEPDVHIEMVGYEPTEKYDIAKIASDLQANKITEQQARDYYAYLGLPEDKIADINTFLKDNIRLGDGAWLARTDYESMPPKLQQILTARGYDAYTKYLKDMGEAVGTAEDPYAVVKQWLELTGVTAGMAPAEGIKQQEWLNQYVSANAEDNTALKAAAQLYAINPDKYATLKDAFDFSQANIQLKSGEWVDRASYDAMPKAERQLLQSLGTVKYQEHQEELYVQIPDGKGNITWLDRTFYNTLSPDDRRLLRSEGLAAWENAQGQKEAQFRRDNIELPDGKGGSIWISKSDYSSMPQQLKAMVNDKKQGWAAVEAFQNTSPEKQFATMQQWGMIPDKARFEGVDKDGNIQYSWSLSYYKHGVDKAPEGYKWVQIAPRTAGVLPPPEEWWQLVPEGTTTWGIVKEQTLHEVPFYDIATNWNTMSTSEKAMTLAGDIITTAFLIGAVADLAGMGIKGIASRFTGGAEPKSQIATAKANVKYCEDVIRGNYGERQVDLYRGMAKAQSDYARLYKSNPMSPKTIEAGQRLNLKAGELVKSLQGKATQVQLSDISKALPRLLTQAVERGVQARLEPLSGKRGELESLKGQIDKLVDKVDRLYDTGSFEGYAKAKIELHQARLDYAESVSLRISKLEAKAQELQSRIRKATNNNQRDRLTNAREKLIEQIEQLQLEITELGRLGVQPKVVKVDTDLESLKAQEKAYDRWLDKHGDSKQTQKVKELRDLTHQQIRTITVERPKVKPIFENVREFVPGKNLPAKYTGKAGKPATKGKAVEKARITPKQRQQALRVLKKLQRLQKRKQAIKLAPNVQRQLAIAVKASAKPGIAPTQQGAIKPIQVEKIKPVPTPIPTEKLSPKHGLKQVVSPSPTIKAQFKPTPKPAPQIRHALKSTPVPKAVAQTKTAPAPKLRHAVKEATELRHAVKAPIQIKVPPSRKTAEDRRILKHQLSAEQEQQLVATKGVVGWKQGLFYVYWKPPYNRTDMVYSRKPIAGIPQLEGRMSAIRSIRKLRQKGKLPEKIGLDMGIMDVQIVTPRSGEGKPQLKYKRDVKQRTQITGVMAGSKS